jgi:glucans biosynthesis protein
MDVSATLFARRKLGHVGLAPLTSMFLSGPASQRVTADVRPGVFNSEGLAILNGTGERIWRPLANPKKLETSAFMDQDPKGFGLAQRERSFAAFEDLDARFERRPTVWVEPKGPWGAGYVELVEIPSEEQIHDNIVAYWKPAKALEPGAPFTFGYRLSWGEDVPTPWSAARVRKTRVGKVRKGDRQNQIFVVDFDGPAFAELRELPRPEVAASAGTIVHLSVARHPHIDGVRVKFELDAADSEAVELRLALKSGEQIISESWLFRWTQS